MNYQNISKTINALIFLSAVLLLQKPAYSQFNINSGSDFSIDDNINSNYQNIFDRNIEMFIDAGYDIEFDNDGLYFNYFGLYNYYTINSKYSYQNHAAMISYYDNYFSSDLRLNLTGYYSLSLNTDDYAYLNNSGYGFEGALYYASSYKNNYTFSLALNLTRFTEMKEFSNINLIGGLKSKHVVSTNTLIGGELQIGIKSYLSQLVNTVSLKKGRKAKSDNDKMNTYLIKGLAEIEHSFSRSTMFGIELGYQKNFMDNAVYLSPNEYSSSVNQLDDEFSFTGYSVMFDFKQKFLSNFIGRIGFDFERREFINRPAFNINDVAISSERIDNLSKFYFELEKKFSHFTIGLNYEYIRNDSNDEWFNASNSIYSMRFSVEY